MKCTSFLPLTILLAPAAAKVYTGFNYGGFWGEQSNIKRYADFHHGFELAKNLTNAPVPFDSARLYTCITTGSKDDPTEAFQAAIDTGTNLLLGMWVSPKATGQPNDVQVENELAALNKGFAQHGQRLADLVIGLSVGNEDVYRFNNAQVGIASDNLLLTIKSVREKIAASPYAKYMEGKPIGHTDTAHYAVVPGSDFVGMTGYPYWEGHSIDNANISFMSLLKDTQRRAGTIPVWISEMGWPINGTQIKQAAASADNYQRYWNEVGCQVFGKYNTFWFGLLQDSQPDQPDWGLLDTKTHQPRIRDLSCGGRSNMTAPAAVRPLSSSSARSTSLASPLSSLSALLPPSSPMPAPPPSTLLTVTTPALVSQPASPPPVSQSPTSASSIHSPSSLPSSTASAPPPRTTSPPATVTPSPSTDAGCVVVNGKTWVAAWDEHGKKHISGTGLECPAIPTSPPNVEPPSLLILTESLEEWKTQSWAAPIPPPVSTSSQPTALAAMPFPSPTAASTLSSVSTSAPTSIPTSSIQRSPGPAVPKDPTEEQLDLGLQGGPRPTPLGLANNPVSVMTPLGFPTRPVQLIPVPSDHVGFFHSLQ
ncbi:glycoside hydrolase family 17 protein, partial [Macroventuria anomochaeta]